MSEQTAFEQQYEDAVREFGTARTLAEERVRAVVRRLPRLEREAGKDAGQQVNRAFELAYLRAPSQTERAAAVDFLKSNPDSLVDFCQALFNSNEFVYMP